MTFGSASMGAGAVQPSTDVMDMAPLPSGRRPAIRGWTGGISGKLVRFGAWMAHQRGTPTPEQVMSRFEIGRATAYRWLRLWREAAP